MNLGTLKLYKLFLIFGAVLFISACTNKEVVQKVETLIIEEVTKIEKQVSTKVPVPLKEVSQVIQKVKTIPKKTVIANVKQDTKVEAKEIVVKSKKPASTNKEMKSTANNDNKNIRESSKLNKKYISDFDFDFIKMGKSDKNTLLIVGGIQGDEPGGFMAASLMSTHYKITKGSVWIVPNLNFYSIIKRSRGPFGDMNRKFANLSKKDPDYKIVQRIKKYISHPDVSMILNLHDGSGYYRPTYIDNNHQPKKWGQTVIIDQEVLPNVKKYANTYEISEEVVKHINKFLLKKEDIYRTKNTHTRFKKTHTEQEMAKTLTYYAVSNGKSAFGHETSKSLTVAQRVYYKLIALEKFMDIMGIKYERNFSMDIKSIKKVLNEDISIKFDDTNIVMPLYDIRNIQKYFPIEKDGIVKYFPSNPLIKIIKKGKKYTVYYGNRRLTHLEADYSEHLNFKTEVTYMVDGKKKNIKFGDTIAVRDSFLVKKNNIYRVNVIGYKNKNNIETNVSIKKSMFIKKYSVEKNGKLYRIEYYKDKKFAGMILVKFI
jgi:hypothetical protein